MECNDDRKSNKLGYFLTEEEIQSRNPDEEHNKRKKDRTTFKRAFYLIKIFLVMLLLPQFKVSKTITKVVQVILYVVNVAFVLCLAVPIVLAAITDVILDSNPTYKSSVAKISQITFIVIVLVVCTVCINALWVRLIMIRRSLHLGRFLRDLRDVYECPSEQKCPLFRRLTIYVLLMSIPLIIITIFLLVAYSHIGDSHDDWLMTVIVEVGVGTGFLILFTLLFYNYLWLFVCIALADSFHALRERIDTTIKENKKEDLRKELEELRTKYQTLQELTDRANQYLGGCMLLSIVSMGMIVTTLGYVLFYVPEKATTSQGEACIFVCLASLGNLFIMSIEGDRIMGKSSSCEVAMLVCPTYSQYNFETRDLMRHFIAQIHHYPVSLTAWGAFSINRANFLGMLSAIVTYLIILMQEKVDDKGDCNQLSSNISSAISP